jgi:hypothetical protein
MQAGFSINVIAEKVFEKYNEAAGFMLNARLNY